MYSFISHIKFLFSATNQHGVHSPFIYSYITKGLYTKKKFATLKGVDILLKSIHYFNIKNLKIDSESSLYKNNIKTNFPNLETNASQFDGIYLENCKDWNNTIIEKEIKNTTWVLINNIHHNREENSFWEKIKKQKEVKVSIDFFYCGILFFRKEQEKEHFKIRY